jgi:hypothetical protein
MRTIIILGFFVLSYAIDRNIEGNIDVMFLITFLMIISIALDAVDLFYLIDKWKHLKRKLHQKDS